MKVIRDRLGLSDDEIGPSLVVSGTVDDAGASDFLLLSGESIFPTGSWSASKRLATILGDQIELNRRHTIWPF
jgi:hypothetical protein